jgi:predicted Zn finger-like uncharacterized protein
MLIVCPSCASTYSLTREQLGVEGRSVRCARCRETWFAATIDATPEEADLVAPAVVAITGPKPGKLDAILRVPLRMWQEAKAAPARWLSRLPTPQRPPAGALTGAALAMLVAAFVLQRETFVALAPQTAKLYAALGLPVNLRGLEFASVNTAMGMDEDQPVLIVQGEIRNIRSASVDVPPIRVMLRGADGRDIYEWTADAPRTTLGTGETVVFRTRLASPPTDGRDVVVRFADLRPHGSSAR